MKVSLISTVFNEEKNIKEFVESLADQTKKPDEFIIVDGGSDDGTFDTLKDLARKYKWMKTYQVKGANISKGRNYAISRTKNEIIVSVDAGSKYKGDWLENLVNGFNGEVSFGMEEPLIENDFQKILAKKLLHKGVPGSSRNMIFLKKIWKEVGGYPEDMKRAEDTLFDERIKKAGYKISRVPDAICYWEMRKNLKEVKKQFYGYGYWDGILQKRHRILPAKYKFLIVLLFAALPLYPLAWMVSRLSLGLKIDFERRYAYFFGFMKGMFKEK